jgi:hypothetical protein
MWWAWFLLGAASVIAAYLILVNVIAWWQGRADARVADAAPYIATPGARRVVHFKREDEADGEEIGPVFITDDDHPEFLHELGWMKISDAREVARALGHPFNLE